MHRNRRRRPPRTTRMGCSRCRRVLTVGGPAAAAVTAHRFGTVVYTFFNFFLASAKPKVDLLDAARDSPSPCAAGGSTPRGSTALPKRGSESRLRSCGWKMGRSRSRDRRSSHKSSRRGSRSRSRDRSRRKKSRSRSRSRGRRSDKKNADTEVVDKKVADTNGAGKSAPAVEGEAPKKEPEGAAEEAKPAGRGGRSRSRSGSRGRRKRSKSRDRRRRRSRSSSSSRSKSPKKDKPKKILSSGKVSGWGQMAPAGAA